MNRAVEAFFAGAEEAAELARCTELINCPAALHVAGCVYDSFSGDLSPEANAPVVGELVFRAGREGEPPGMILLSADEQTGVAMVAWGHRGRPVTVDDYDRAQCAVLQYMTSSPKVARASIRDLKRAGWPIP